MINTNKSKSNSKAVLFTKIIIFFVTIVTIFLAKTYGVQTGNKSAPMKDPIMNDLTSFNDLVNQNEQLAKALQISSSLLMDLSFIAIAFYWVSCINTGRLLYTMACFYIGRFVIQQVVTFPYPAGNKWDYPGFPSLIIPYGASNDFFWSGHCGFLMILTLEWYQNKQIVMVLITIGINIYMAFVMVGFRIHYTVDIVIGVVMGHYFYMIVCKFNMKIDDFLKYWYWKGVNKVGGKKNNSDNNLSNTFQQQQIEQLEQV